MTEIMPKKTPRVSKGSIVLLVLVMLITTLLYLYNTKLEKDISKVKLNITSIEANIKEVVNDEKVVVYSLLNLNQKYITKLESTSNISKYIDHMNFIQDKYSLQFTNFSIKNGEIKTSLEINSDDELIAYEKARDFIKKYRNDKFSLFDLGFVGSIKGMDDIKFDVRFNIK